MAHKNFKWTPEALEYLRQWDGLVSNLSIAKRLGCTYWAVTSKKREFNFLANRAHKLPPLERYARIYSVPKRVVEFFGVETLTAMNEETRRRTLWNARKTMAPSRTKSETIDHVERMMELARKAV